MPGVRFITEPPFKLALPFKIVLPFKLVLPCLFKMVLSSEVALPRVVDVTPLNGAGLLIRSDSSCAKAVAAAITCKNNKQQ